MHPFDTQLIAPQRHAENLRRAAMIHRLPADPRPVRARLGDTLIGAGNWLATLGDRMIPTAPPPDASPTLRSNQGVCVSC